MQLNLLYAIIIITIILLIYGNIIDRNYRNVEGLSNAIEQSVVSYQAPWSYPDTVPNDYLANTSKFPVINTFYSDPTDNISPNPSLELNYPYTMLAPDDSWWLFGQGQRNSGILV
jgi:hypothetical protein